MKSKIKSILKKTLSKSAKFNDKTDLIKKNYLDSFSLMVLITSLEKEFKIKIELAKVDINSLSSINKIEKYIKKVNK
tara:strand:+ start:422 stop:652 length:231 start_codon:yes stop_codon:yes gene_type:complete